MKPFGKFIFLVVLAAGPAAAQGMTITPDFDRLQLDYTNGGPPGFVLRWKPFIQRGRLAVCGGYVWGDHGYYTVSRATLRRAFVEVDGRVVARDLTFLADHGFAADVIGRSAACQQFDVAVTRNSEIRLSWPGN